LQTQQATGAAEGRAEYTGIPGHNLQVGGPFALDTKLVTLFQTACLLGVMQSFQFSICPAGCVQMQSGVAGGGAEAATGVEQQGLASPNTLRRTRGTVSRPPVSFSGNHIVRPMRLRNTDADQDRIRRKV
jgi:hypothetical protein